MVAMKNDDVILAIFGAFATFTAFGAAVVGFVAAGGVVQSLASWWEQHGKTEAIEKAAKRQLKLNARREQPGAGKAQPGAGKAQPSAAKWLGKAFKNAGRRSPFTSVISGVIIGLVVLISGLGLIFSFIWLDAYSHGSTANVQWAYSWIVRLFCVEVALLTLATLAAVGGATFSALNASKSADSSSELDDLVRTVPVGWLDGKVAQR